MSDYSPTTPRAQIRAKTNYKFARMLINAVTGLSVLAAVVLSVLMFVACVDGRADSVPFESHLTALWASTLVTALAVLISAQLLHAILDIADTAILTHDLQSSQK